MVFMDEQRAAGNRSKGLDFRLSFSTSWLQSLGKVNGILLFSSMKYNDLFQLR